MKSFSQLDSQHPFHQPHPGQEQHGAWGAPAEARLGDPRRLGHAPHSAPQGFDQSAYHQGGAAEGSVPPWMRTQRPTMMPQAFVPTHGPGAGASLMQPQPVWHSAPQAAPHPFHAQQSAVAHSPAQAMPMMQPRPAGEVSLQTIGKTLQQAHAEMHDEMGSFARKGSVYLTRIGNVISLLGAGGAAAAIVVGGAGMASGIGIPVGALAAVVGVGVLIAGMGVSALAGAGARSIARRSINKNPQLRAKLAALRELHTELVKIEQPTPDERTLIRDVETTLRATDSRFSLALKRHAKSAAKAPLYVLAGAVVCLPAIAAISGESSLFAPFGSGDSGLFGGSGSDGGRSLSLSGREHQHVRLTPKMGQLLQFLDQPPVA